MKIKHIEIKDKRAIYNPEGGKIVCGNSKYKIEFTFDEEWDEYPTKKARFIVYRNGRYEHIDVEFEGNVCPIPPLSNVADVKIGVYVDGGISTTTAAVIECEKSILCGKSSARYSDEEIKALNEAFKGKDGITPKKGVDYWTEADKEELAQEILGDGEIPDGNLVKWDEEHQKFADAQTSLNMFTPNRLVQGGHFLYINKSGAHSNSYWAKMSGIVIPISGEYHGADNVCQDAYAIVFDHKTKTLRLGTGQIIHSKNIYTGEGEIDYSYFEFGGYLHENGTEDEAIATRADDFTEGNIPKWDAQRNMFVDSGKSIDNIGGGSSADFENIREQIVYLYSRTDDISSSLGDISSAFDELHAYAQSLVGGVE